jgi:hypothetical protein
VCTSNATIRFAKLAGFNREPHTITTTITPIEPIFGFKKSTRST